MDPGLPCGVMGHSGLRGRSGCSTGVNVPDTHELYTFNMVILCCVNLLQLKKINTIKNSLSEKLESNTLQDR